MGNGSVEFDNDKNLSEERTLEVKHDWLKNYLNQRHTTPANKPCYSEKGPFPSPNAGSDGGGISWGPYDFQPNGWQYNGPNHYLTNELDEIEYQGGGYRSDYRAVSHFGMSFKSRRCSGKKTNFVLLNDPYRAPMNFGKTLMQNLFPWLRTGRLLPFM